jgi:hypothetical protein
MFQRPILLLALVLLTSPARGESIDGRVVQVRLPAEDFTLFYVETKGGMTIELRGATASFTGTKFLVGDGEIALPLEVDPGRGIVFQKANRLRQGFEFKNTGTIRMLPGWRRAVDLKPGEIYVTLPGVRFVRPGE